MADVFTTHLEWTGAAKERPSDPMKFSRDLEASLSGHTLMLSAAPAFKGDPSRGNPEQLFVAALSSCQALTYLFWAAKSGISILRYLDDAEGHLGLSEGRMRMTRVVLRPHVTISAESDAVKARELVEHAHGQCFVANSVTTHVELLPTIEVAGE